MSDDESTTTDPGTDADVIVAIHDHLDATAELPVDPKASTYLGEATAVAADARAAIRDGHHDAARTRIEQVHDLLSHVDDTGNETADEHVHEAAQLTNEFLADKNTDQYD